MGEWRIPYHFLRRTWLLLFMGAAVLFLSASGIHSGNSALPPASHSASPDSSNTTSRSTAGPTPYRLIYPAYYGNRINATPDNPLTEEGVRLGRLLFYEKRLSANNSISCGTCHQQQYAFTDGKTFSRGFDGVPTRRNALSLDNLLWVRHFFWDGRANSMEQQVLVPMTDPHEMGQSLETSVQKLRQVDFYPGLFAAAFGSDTSASGMPMPSAPASAHSVPRSPAPNAITADRIIKALTQFERTLISANSAYDKYLRGDYQLTAAEQKGITLFYTNPDPAKGIRGAGCDHCHGGPRTFNDLYENNGLDSLPKDKGREEITGLSSDRGRFRVATLRNIALTAPYMHDGRFKTLEEVLDHYSEHLRQTDVLSPILRNNSNEVNGTSLKLTMEERNNLIAFLHMLTDSSFVKDPRFSDPFSETNHKR